MGSFRSFILSIVVYRACVVRQVRRPQRDTYKQVRQNSYSILPLPYHQHLLWAVVASTRSQNSLFLPCGFGGMTCLLECLCTTCLSGDWRSQKKASGPLEVELDGCGCSVGHVNLVFPESTQSCNCGTILCLLIN